MKSVGLGSGSKLLGSLKSRVVYLASSFGIVSTVQKAAQATLQASWSILLPTANERAQTLSSLLPNAGEFPFNSGIIDHVFDLILNKSFYLGIETAVISCGQRFMTDLLVWSLMADGGLETALFDALRAEIVELADIDETFDIPTSQTTIPLLHLVKQLLRYLYYTRRSFIINLVLSRTR